MVRASRSPRGNRNSGRGSPPAARIACSARRELLPDRGVGEPGEARMGHGVVAQPVATRHDRGDSGRVGGGPVAGQEERAAHAGGGQGLQDARQPGRVGAGVERQRHHRPAPGITSRSRPASAAGNGGGAGAGGRRRRGQASGAGRRRRAGRACRDRFAGGGDRWPAGGAGVAVAGTRRPVRRRASARTHRGLSVADGDDAGAAEGGTDEKTTAKTTAAASRQHGSRGREPAASLAPEDRPHASLWRHRPQPD